MTVHGKCKIDLKGFNQFQINKCAFFSVLQLVAVLKTNNYLEEKKILVDIL